MLYLPQERGQGLAEYGLILVLIAVVVVVALVALGPVVRDLYAEVVDQLP